MQHIKSVIWRVKERGKRQIKKDRWGPGTCGTYPDWKGKKKELMTSKLAPKRVLLLTVSNLHWVLCCWLHIHHIQHSKLMVAAWINNHRLLTVSNMIPHGSQLDDGKLWEGETEWTWSKASLLRYRGRRDSACTHSLFPVRSDNLLIHDWHSGEIDRETRER